MKETIDRLTARRRHARFGGFSLDARAYGVRLNDSIFAARGIARVGFLGEDSWRATLAYASGYFFNGLLDRLTAQVT